MRWVVNATPWLFYPRERQGIHCIGGWVGPRAGVDGRGKSHPHRDSNLGPSSRYTDCAIPAHMYVCIYILHKTIPIQQVPGHSRG